ncbi:MAG: hypothetical protein ACJ79R_07105 [Anaeromyxobacteraceae bacterium]
MATCPLCENEQASGDACDVCGRPLAAGAGPPPPSQAIDGLEPTLFERVEGADPGPIEGLEPTAMEAAPDDGAGSVDWLDRTAHDAAAGPDLTPVELEVTALAPHERAARDPAAPIACRYCRTPAEAEAAFCGRCGMKIEVYRPSVPPRRAP